jgi:hypothetical protein
MPIQHQGLSCYFEDTFFCGRVSGHRTASVQHVYRSRQPTHAWVGHRASIYKDAHQRVLERFHVI